MFKISSIKSTRAFTLIELLVVISIIGILAAVVLAALNGARQKGNNGRITEEVTQMRGDLELVRLPTSKYPTTALTPNGPGEYNAAIADASTLALANDIANLNKGVVDLGGASIAATTGVAVIVDVIGAANPPSKYAIYALLGTPATPTGYFCVDSQGDTLTSNIAPNWTTSGTNPLDVAAASTCR